MCGKHKKYRNFYCLKEMIANFKLKEKKNFFSFVEKFASRKDKFKENTTSSSPAEMFFSFTSKVVSGKTKNIV